MITAGAFIVGLVCGFVGYAWLSAPERRRSARCLAKVEAARRKAEDQRDTLKRQLGESNRIAAVLVTRLPGDTPIAEHVSAAVEAQNIGDIDQEWANLNAQADVERFWGEES